MINYFGVMARGNHNPKNLSLGEIPQCSDERNVRCKKRFFDRKAKTSSKRCDIEQNLQQSGN